MFMLDCICIKCVVWFDLFDCLIVLLLLWVRWIRFDWVRWFYWLLVSDGYFCALIDLLSMLDCCLLMLVVCFCWD